MRRRLFTGFAGNKRGSLTIEIMLVFTTVFFSLALLLTGFMLLYNKLVLMKTAVEAAREAALMRQTEAPDGYAELERRIEQSLEGFVLQPKNTMVRVTVDKLLWSNTLRVTLVQEYSMPFGRLKAVFDGEEFITLTGTGEATLLEPVQYIRSVDLGLEYFQRIRERTAAP
ncbi:MAG: hypothetical protein RBT41_04830 [Clostridia bacterium]|jgi:hypothetical protein|nr:hypothetical protein [Clostridia bacterium]